MSIPLIIVVIYMFSLLFCSWWVTQKKNSGADASSFLMASQQLPWLLVSVTVAGLAIGGSSTVGVAQNAYTKGLSAGWYCFAWAIACAIYGLFFATKYRSYSIKTINELVRKVYGEKIGFVTVIMQFFNNFAMNAMQIVAGGAILASLLPDVFDKKQAMFVSMIVFLCVAVVGGLWAASLSNIINVTVIYFGLIIGLVVAFSHFGGAGNVLSTLPENPHWFNLFSGMGAKAVLAWIVSLSFSALASQAMVQSAVSAKDSKHARRGFLIAAVLIIPIGLICPFIGMIAASQFPGLENASQALPSVMLSITPVVAGLALSGLWAADVSTATVLLVSQSTMLTRDVVVKYINPKMSDKSQIIFSRVSMIAVAFLGYLLATTVTSILDAITTFMSVVSPLAVVCILTVHFPKLARKTTAHWVYGLGCPTFVLIVLGIIPKVGGHAIYLTVLAGVIGWIISLITDKRPIDVSVLYADEKIPEKK